MEQAQVDAATEFQVTITDAHPISAVNPQPTHGGATASHPSYAEMITAAIVADSLQGKEGGSSKRSIAKYIERVYSNLPPTHSVLLTHHLKTLKNSGLLVTVKNSYQLSPHLRSAPPPVPPSPAGNPNTALSPKRGPGRPPKAKTAQPNSSTPGLGNGTTESKKRRGRPPKPLSEVPFVEPISRAESNQVYASDPALVNGSQPVQKRRPGRPSKQAFGQPISEAQQRGPGLVDVPVNGPRRRPGRQRGRPKKNALGPINTRPVGKRPRGRPPKQGGGVGMVQGKRRGRPPKSSGGGPVKPRRRTGKPLGRPKKNAASEQGHRMANEELMRKLEHIQLKLRDAVGILRPHFAHEHGGDALTVLQQLEELAETAPPPTMSLTASQIPSVPVSVADHPPPIMTETAASSTEAAPELFGVTMPPMTVPFYAPSGIDIQQPVSWMPSTNAQS